MVAPGIFKQADRLGKIDLWSSLQETLKIIDQCWEVDAALGRFYEEYTANLPDRLYWLKLSKTSDGLGEEKVFPVAFHFIDLRTANTLMYYWSTLLMLWSGLCRLYQHISNLDSQGFSIYNMHVSGSEDDRSPSESTLPRPTADRLPLLVHRTDFASVAWNICQSVEYCMQEDMLDFGPQSVAVPLQIVVETLRGIPTYSRQLLWAEKVLEQVTRRGIRILKYALE